MTQPDPLAPLPDSDLATDATEHEIPSTSRIPHTRLKFSLGSTAHSSLWAAEYEPAPEQNPLGLPAGSYTLEELVRNERSVHLLRPADRLCSLPEHPHVATVYAIASSKAHDQIWYEEAEAGTLADVLEKRGKISAEEVAKITAALAQGLNWLHEQQMVFEEFSAERVLFTLSGEIKLLAPTKDLRGSTAAVLHDGVEQDTAAVAKLIWRCLTGELPGVLHQRAPLKLLIPDSHPELGATLERAIDREKPQPTLTEISALITHHYSPAEVDLFASAHPSVRSYIPAIEVPTQSQLGSKSRFGRRIPAKSVAKSAQKKQPQWFHPAVITASLCAVSGAVFLLGHYLDAENVPLAAQTSSTPTKTPPAPSSSSASAGATSSSLPALTTPSTEEHPDMNVLLTSLINQRNQVLASGQSQNVVRYTVADSTLANADAELISRDTKRQLAHMPLEVTRIESVEEDAQPHQKAVIAVVSRGPAPEAQASGAGQQRVKFVVEEKGHEWKIISATPLDSPPVTP